MAYLGLSQIRRCRRLSARAVGVPEAYLPQADMLEAITTATKAQLVLRGGSSEGAQKGDGTQRPGTLLCDNGITILHLFMKISLPSCILLQRARLLVRLSIGHHALGTRGSWTLAHDRIKTPPRRSAR